MPLVTLVNGSPVGTDREKAKTNKKSKIPNVQKTEIANHQFRVWEKITPKELIYKNENRAKKFVKMFVFQITPVFRFQASENLDPKEPIEKTEK